MILSVLARASGPSDIHDQTQPKTLAYSMDLARHASNWALPMEVGERYATKPPLYNWLAAPFVALTDGRSVFAHKAPSVLAYVAIAGLLWLVASRMAPRTPVAAFAVMAFAVGPSWFKLAYLARPDTVLTLWLILGWIAGTALVLPGPAPSRRSVFGWRIALWGAGSLAILTKGPPALAIPVHALTLGALATAAAAARSRDGAGRLQCCGRGAALAVRRTGMWWGLPLMLGVGAMWVGIAYLVDAEHTRQVLLGDEIIGRVTGTGPEGVKEGPWDFVRTAPNMPFYFLVRFLPWSVLFVGALIDLFGADRDGRVRGWPDGDRSPAEHRWILSSLVYIAVVIVGFSLAAGKRADYIASAFVPAALVVGWWLWARGWRLGAQAPWGVVGLAAATLLVLTVVERRLGYGVKYPLGDSLEAFAEEANRAIDGRPLPVEFFEVERRPLQAIMGFAQRDLDPAEALDRIEARAPLWLVAESSAAESLARAALDRGLTFDTVQRSKPAIGMDGAAPFAAGLYLVLRDESQ
ncbi:MAG: ArnT family glycosyltransferase [Phycisphaerales bacterium]